MDGTGKLLKGAAAGALLMYVFDPDQGRRRRARVRDKTASAAHQVQWAAGKTQRDLSNRAHGLVGRVESRLHRDVATDDVIVERVRATLGRVVTHPSAIEVQSDDGCVLLRGPILAHEVDRLMNRVRKVRGVKEVDNRLDVYESAENVPGLQGGGRPRLDLPEIRQRNWTPVMRVAAGMAGGLLALRGLRRGGIVGTGMGALGAGLLARAASNRPVREVIGAASRPDAVHFQKTIHVDTPVEQTYRFWTNYENFPRFMEHVREVRDLGNGRSHWVASGPAGLPVEWDAVITQQQPNRIIAWRSAEGSVIGTTGRVRFDAEPPEQQGTRIDIQMSYTPPAGAVGHAVASLLGADPKRALDEDMVRLKSLLETGKTSVRGEDVTTAEVAPGAHPTV